MVAGMYELLRLSRIVIHTADLSNCVRPFPVSRHYALKLYDEFAIQVQEEKRRGLPASASAATMAPATRAALCEAEVGFIKFVVRRYFSAVGDAFPPLRGLSRVLELNLQCWEAEALAEVAAAAAAAAAGVEVGAGAGAGVGVRVGVGAGGGVAAGVAAGVGVEAAAEAGAEAGVVAVKAEDRAEAQSEASSAQEQPNGKE